MRIEQATASTISQLWQGVEPRVLSADSLEVAAQALAEALHSRFDESVVIARVFVTVPFEKLPAANQTFVRALADSAGAAGQLWPDTPVLSLLGTHGEEKDWNDRRNSKGHAGIPLVSASFVEAIPMISRLLRELGVPVHWVDSHDAQVIVDAIGGTAGLFYVQDAAAARDQQGRKIIAAQDFVTRYGVKSVFGLGGAYADGQMVVMVAFCRDACARTAAERFLALVPLFTTKTTALSEAGRVFAGA